MSRDAKVGLVIIFSFVFLLGTILLHRFPLTDGDGGGVFNEPSVSESDPEATLADSTPRYPGADDKIPASVVDAVPAETRSSRGQPDLSQVRDSGFGDGQKSRRTPNLARPPAEFPTSQSNGALISLTEGETTQPLTQQRAAVLESNGSAQRQVRRGGDNAGGNGAADNPTNHASPLLEIHTPARDSDQDQPFASREQPNRFFSSSGDGTKKGVTTSVLEGQGGNKVSPFANEMSPDEATRDIQESTARTDIASEVEEHVDPHASDDRRRSSETTTTSSDGMDNDSTVARSSAGRSQRTPFTFDDSDRVQQAEGKRQAPHGLDSPPSLPKYGDSSQATIESVPARSGQSDYNVTDSLNALPSRSKPSKGITAEESTNTEDVPNNAQRTYVVKEGDSFWTISAKHYGTGKYFRTLEDYNRHRLPAYEDGVRILRPGTEILLPSVAVLRSKSSVPKSSSDGPKETVVPERDGFKPRQNLDRVERDFHDTLPRQSGGVAATSAASRVYRVKEGDSLSKIAQRELGASKRWQEIYELNADKLAGQDVLKIGMELRIPGDRPVEKLVERPSDSR
jgi:nucleoid-associated protein YgaU